MNDSGKGRNSAGPPIPPPIEVLSTAAAAALPAAGPSQPRAVAGKASLVCVLTALAVFLMMLILKPG